MLTNIEGVLPLLLCSPYAQSTNRAAESALGIIVRAMQAIAAINGAAILSGSARLPRNGFKKKKDNLDIGPQIPKNYVQMPG